MRWTVSRSGNSYWGSSKYPKAIVAEASTHDVGSKCLKSHHTWTFKGQSILACKSLRSWYSWVEGACGPDTEQDPVGFLDPKGILCSCFLITGNRLHSTSGTFPALQWAGSNSLNREGRRWRDKGGAVKRNTSSALGQHSGSSSRDTQNYLWAVLQILKSPPEGRN